MIDKDALFDAELADMLTKAAAIEAALNVKNYRHFGLPVVWSYGLWRDNWPEFEPRPVTIFGHIAKAEA